MKPSSNDHRDSHDALALLLARHSSPSRQMEAPGPDEATLKRLLTAAIRVPDHGKLEPFRLILLRDQGKQQFGERVAALALQRKPDMSESKQAKEANRYRYAPLVVVVVASIDADSSKPAIEQHYSAGCVAYNLLLGCQALGFGAQWLTGWAAYDENVGKLLGLGKHESVAGFVHIGTVHIEIPDRDRPKLKKLLSEWSPKHA